MKGRAKRPAPAADTQHPAAVFARRIRAALAHDRAEGAHVRTFCDPVGFDPSAPDVVDALAALAADDVEEACSALCVARPLRASVACRLAEHWPIFDIETEPLGDVRGLDAAARERELWMADGLIRISTMEMLAEEAGAIPPRMYWPSNVSMDDVIAVVSRCKHKDARVIAASLRAGQWYVAAPGDPTRHRPGAIMPKAENYVQRKTAEGLRVTIADPDLYRALGTVFHPRLAALVAWAEKGVDDARRLPCIAVDAGKHTTGLLNLWGRTEWDVDPRTGLADVPQLSRRERDAGFRVLVCSRDGTLQLQLPFDGSVGPDVFEAVRRHDALRGALGSPGLRHLAAFLYLLSTKGARSGQLLWKVADHMDAMQCGADTRRDPKARERIAREAAAVAGLQLVVIGDGADTRVSRPLLLPVDTAERRGPDGRWALEGMTLQYHPLLNSGVRKASGEIGEHWFPASPDLPSLHHVKHAPALLAGLRLPQRWRYAWKDDECTFVDLKHENAFALFGIEGDASRGHHKGRAWETFDANVAALAALPTPGIGPVERVRSTRDGEPMVRIHAARWMIERTIHRVRAIEAPPPPQLNCGNDLRRWREQRGLTQGALATLLGVSARTVRGAELSADAPLPRKVRDAIEGGHITQAPRALPSPR